MDITKTIPYRVRVSKIRNEFSKLKQSRLDRDDAYITDHAIQRMAERDLHKDVPFVFCAYKYFVTEVFDKITYTSRNYRINFRGLVICCSIESRYFYGKTNRVAVLKTVFDHDVNYDVDEVITLK